MNNSRAIAIVGIGGVLPGAATLDEFWANILAGRDAAREVPPGRWPLSLDDAHAPGPAADRVYSRRACFIEAVEPDFSDLAIDPPLVASLDPMFHLALAAGSQAWNDAGMGGIDRRRVGVVLGNIALPTDTASGLADEYLGSLYRSSILGKQSPSADSRTESLNRYVAGLPGGVLAKALGLGGGSFTLDAACASSLYALKLAADQLHSGRVDAMLAGGLSRPDSLYTQMGFSQLGALSPSGRCAPFDATADGLVVGEGAGIFVLRRLEDAVAEGQHIYAVIRGIGLSNDVGGNLMSPDSEGQLRAMRTAYAEAGWSPTDVQLFECHGTGTPVGDAVELKSLTQLFERNAQPARRAIVGSVKSNVGHLLTAAGAAATIKVLLAMKHGKLPPTANFSHPTDEIDWERCPLQVLSKPEAWAPASAEQPRRAAVSAFGFGGINAHVLLEQWPDVSSQTAVAGLGNRKAASEPTAKEAPGDAQPAEPIAVVGLGAHVGPWNSLRSFTRRVLGGDADRRPTSLANRWGSNVGESFRGFLIDSLEFPLTQFRIPPTELRDMLPQQLLMLKVAAEALADADLDGNDESRVRTGVFVGIALDLNTTNFHLRWMLRRQLPRWAAELGFDPSQAELDAWIAAAQDAVSPPLTANRTMGSLGGIVASRIARAFRIGGPSFTISSEETSGLSALGVALDALRNGEIDTAIVGAVDLAGDIRAVLGQHERRPYLQELASLQSAANGELPVVGEGAVALVLKRRDDAVREGDRIYATFCGLGNATGDGIEQAKPSAEAYDAAIREALGDSEPSSIGHFDTNGKDCECELFGSETTALGSAVSQVGHTGAASALVSVVKSCLALHHRVIPPSDLPLDDDARTSKARYWLHDRDAGPRRAMVGSLSVDGNAACVVMEADEHSAPNPGVHAVWATEEALFAIEGGDANELLQKLDQLRGIASRYDAQGIEPLAQVWLEANPSNSDAALAVCIVADSPASLQTRIEEARRCVSEGTTVAGEHVFFTPQPLSAQGDVAFVYPGSGSHFPGMGRELALAWPGVLDRLESENAQLATQFAGGEFWSRDELRDASPQNLILAQVWLGALVTDVLQHCGVKPQAAIGYSLGETTALLATRTWSERDELLTRMQQSPLFSQQLAGEYTAAREVWKLDAAESCNWRASVVNRAASEVREAVKDYPHVYMLIVNTPAECVIGGLAAEVEAVVAALGCNFWPLEGVSTVHCELAAPVEAAYRAFHHFETTPPADVRFYSCAWGRAYDVTPDSAADALVAKAVGAFDFTRVITAAYEDGVRLFVEIGPGASCSRMITETLGTRPHVARSVCAPGRDGPAAVRRLLALLITHRVPVDVSKTFLQGDESWNVEAKKEPTLTIELNRPACVLPPLRQRPLEPQASPNPAPFVQKHPAAINTRPPATSMTLASNTSQQQQPQLPPRNLTALSSLIDATMAASAAETEAQSAYVSLANFTTAQVQRAVEFQSALLQQLPAEWQAPAAYEGSTNLSSPVAVVEAPLSTNSYSSPVVLDRDGCLEFAVGSIAKSLGERFAEVDRHPTRVRLPDEPLMLVDRILQLEGEPASLTSGRVVTEHDIHAGAWYLDNGRIPTCIAVEAGQADLLLSAYLGIDFETHGKAVYRLLDAVVTFHGELPGPGKTIHYDIHIERFFRQGDTYLFRFYFDATVDGQLLLTMRDGCAGFFSENELAEGQGIITPTIERQKQHDAPPAHWQPLVPMAVESYDDRQLELFRSGDLVGCFGGAFEGLPLTVPSGLPTGRMKLVDRVLRLDPAGGKYSLGMIVGEADIHADDWFLTCHFVDDRVMPGTLMYECCLHTLRVYLARMGWVGEATDVVYEPVPGVAGSLKCRGQVTEATAKVQYELTIKELGYQGPEGTPYVVADALMYADGKPVVQMKDMSLRLSGLTQAGLEAMWAARSATNAHNNSQSTISNFKSTETLSPGATAGLSSSADLSVGTAGQASRGTPTDTYTSSTQNSFAAPRPAIFDYDRINAFAVGNPSEAFGEPYRVFDHDRIIARLPGPPFQFLDRITSIEHCQPWQLAAGGEIVAQYDVPPDAWYFGSHRQGQMPFSVLLEIALQPCGWLAAYLGSALTSETDLSFRNLGGTGTQSLMVTPDTGTLAIEVKITSVANSGGMIIQNYEMAVHSAAGEVYRGKTNFGFFSHQALLQQVGIRDAKGYEVSEDERSRGEQFEYPHEPPFADDMLRMVHHVEHFDPTGGPHRLGFIRGTAKVDPGAWFFKAHFHQDPVWPGSLGLESFLQLLTLVAHRRWGKGVVSPAFETLSHGKPHHWQYRGQIIPTNDEVQIEATITEVDDARKLLRANGLLSVDGRTIYQMTDFTIKLQA